MANTILIKSKADGVGVPTHGSGLKVAEYVHDFEGFGNRLYLEMENGEKNMVDNEKDYREVTIEAYDNSANSSIDSSDVLLGMRTLHYGANLISFRDCLDDDEDNLSAISPSAGLFEKFPLASNSRSEIRILLFEYQTVSRTPFVFSKPCLITSFPSFISGTPWYHEA